MAPLWIGIVAGVVCCYAVGLKAKAGYDDALDVVGVHFVGGLVGSLLIGLFSEPDFFGTDLMAGLFQGCGFALLLEQALWNGVTIVFPFIVRPDRKRAVSGQWFQVRLDLRCRRN